MKTHRRSATNETALLAECQSTLETCYPKLHIVATSPQIVVRGAFPVHLDQQEIDSFLVEIVFPASYSTGIPLVRELGNRIVRDIDHHVLSSGLLCLFAFDQRQTYWNPVKGIKGFFSEALNDFFLGQLYYEQHLVYPFGERSHGLKGIIEYYAEEFDTDDLAVITRGIEYLSRKEVKGHWRCYCGSGIKMRNCHSKKITELRTRISSIDAANTLKLLREEKITYAQ